MNDLIARAKAGDASALEALLAEVAPAVHRFGLRMCKNAHDAEDVLQETLMAIAGHLPEFEGRASFSSWTFAIARSACGRRRRGAKNRPPLSDDHALEVPAAGASPEARASERELARLLSSALDALPDDQREAIQLRDVEGVSVKDAAVAIGITVEALKSRVHRAREALREALRPILEPAAPAPSPACPKVVEMWSKKLEGDLRAADCAEMENHVLGCRACAAACDALKRALLACRMEAAAEVRPEVQARVKDAVRALALTRR